MLLLAVHLTFAIIGDALITLLGVTSLLYLYEDRKLRRKNFSKSLFKLPSLEALDALSLKILVLAIMSTTIGMLTGMKLAWDFWGAKWYLDPRQILSWITWAIFGSIILSRYISGWRGRKAAWITTIGVILTMSGTIGFHVLDYSKHQTLSDKPQHSQGKPE